MIPLGERQAYGVEENLRFHDDLGKTLKNRFASEPQLSVLDFGAGNSNVISLFSGIVPGRTWVTAYDPHLPVEEYTDPSIGDRVVWKNRLNPDARFDLGVAHFSLHHTGKVPFDSVGLVTPYTDKIAIVEYDYTEADLESFQKSFIGIPELKELEDMFGANYEECFAFHRQFGRTDYTEALLSHGFQVVTSVVGSGVAQYKFFLLAEKAS